MGKVNNGRLYHILMLICAVIFLTPAYGQNGEISDVLWKFPTGGRIIGLAESPGTGWIYALSEDRMIYALRQDGVLLWQSERLQRKPLPFLTTGPDGTIYGQTVDNELYAVNPAGRVVWRVKLSGRITGTHRIRSDGVIIYTTSAGIDAARTHLGNLIGRVEKEDTRSEDKKNPLIAVNSGSHFFYDGKPGKPIPGVPYPLPGCPPMVTSSGAFIIGGDDWVVYRMRIPEYPYTGTPVDDEREYKDSAEKGEKDGGKKPREIYTGLLFESASRDILLEVLEENRSQLSKKGTLEQFDSNISTVEQLAGFGMLNPEFRAGRQVNDFPLVRIEAVRILSEFGTLHSRDVLLKIVRYEWDPTVKLEAVRALGDLRSDPDGEVIRTLHHLSKEGGLKYENDPLLGEALIRTVDRLTRYGGLVRGSASQLLNEIYFSTLPRDMRLSAMETLRGFRREKAYSR